MDVSVESQIRNYGRKYAGVGFIYEAVHCGVCGQNVGHNGECRACGNHIIVKVCKDPKITYGSLN